MVSGKQLFVFQETVHFHIFQIALLGAVKFIIIIAPPAYH